MYSLYGLNRNFITHEFQASKSYNLDNPEPVVRFLAETKGFSPNRPARPPIPRLAGIPAEASSQPSTSCGDRISPFHNTPSQRAQGQVYLHGVWSTLILSSHFRLGLARWSLSSFTISDQNSICTFSSLRATATHCLPTTSEAQNL